MPIPPGAAFAQPYGGVNVQALQAFAQSQLMAQLSFGTNTLLLNLLAPSSASGAPYPAAMQGGLYPQQPQLALGGAYGALGPQQLHPVLAASPGAANVQALVAAEVQRLLAAAPAPPQ